MKARRFILGKDYPEICEWWRQWGLKAKDASQSWKYIPVRKLPEIGIIAEDENKKYAVGFAHQCDGQWIIFEWLVTNPQANARERKEGLEVITKAVTEIAKATGREIFSSLHSKGLIRLFEGAGFQKTDTEMTNMVWRAS